MKVRAKTAYFDGGKLRKRGDEYETESFDPIRMILLDDSAPVIEETPKPTRKPRTKK